MDEYLTKQERTAKMKKMAGFWLVIVIVLAGSVFGVYQLSKSDKGTVLGIDISSMDHKFGPDDARVIIINYSDFQCPACAYYSPMLKSLASDYPDDLQIVYRHFPLRTIHPHADLAAYAAEAAGLQEKFWEMSGLIYGRQNDWAKNPNAKTVFLSYASELGLDKSRFEKDIRSEEVRAKVEADLQSAKKLNLNSTPTLILNGNKITNPASMEKFKELIDAELNE
jgi:protein-disulfide isomerase